jgi:hypothetical protein
MHTNPGAQAAPAQHAGRQNAIAVQVAPAPQFAPSEQARLQ